MTDNNKIVYKNDNDLLKAYGIEDARFNSKIADPPAQLRAVNAHSDDAWVPVTGMNFVSGSTPNISLTAWMEIADAPGDFITVITLFRTRNSQIECFVPGNTKYYVGVGIPPF